MMLCINRNMTGFLPLQFDTLTKIRENKMDYSAYVETGIIDHVIGNGKLEAVNGMKDFVYDILALLFMMLHPCEMVDASDKTKLEKCTAVEQTTKKEISNYLRTAEKMGEKIKNKKDAVKFTEEYLKKTKYLGKITDQIVPLIGDEAGEVYLKAMKDSKVITNQAVEGFFRSKIQELNLRGCVTY